MMSAEEDKIKWEHQGPDGFGSRLLKSCTDKLCGTGQHMSNLVLKQNKVPALWKPSSLVHETVCSQHCLSLWTLVSDYHLCQENQVRQRPGGRFLYMLTQPGSGHREAHFSQVTQRPNLNNHVINYLMISIDWSTGMNTHWSCSVWLTLLSELRTLRGGKSRREGGPWARMLRSLGTLKGCLWVRGEMIKPTVAAAAAY